MKRFKIDVELKRDDGSIFMQRDHVVESFDEDGADIVGVFNHVNTVVEAVLKHRRETTVAQIRDPNKK